VICGDFIVTEILTYVSFFYAQEKKALVSTNTKIYRTIKTKNAGELKAGRTFNFGVFRESQR
ncbi:hypothetical protein, partial [Holdemania filiformis]